MTNIPTVHIGAARLTMEQALSLYRERRESLLPAVSAEATALWNAIQRADKLSKNLPVRWLSTPGLRAAERRLERELGG